MKEIEESKLKIKSLKMLFLLGEISLMAARDKIDIYMDLIKYRDSNFNILSFEEVLKSEAW